MGSNERLKSIYGHMKQRCYNSKNPNYPAYGGRGIRICDEWLDSYDAFETWALSNSYADELTLDRIDVNGDYEPANCRWADMKIQGNNKRHYWLPDGIDDFTYDGEPDPEEQEKKRLEIRRRLSNYRLSQVWLISQLAKRGLKTDKTEMSSILAGSRVGAKTEYILNACIEILNQYQTSFVDSP